MGVYRVLYCVSSCNVLYNILQTIPVPFEPRNKISLPDGPYNTRIGRIKASTQFSGTRYVILGICVDYRQITERNNYVHELVMFPLLAREKREAALPDMAFICV